MPRGVQVLLVAVLASPAPATAALGWDLEGRGESARSGPVLEDRQEARVTLWSPGPRAVKLANGRPELPATAPGYYQALVAVRRTGEGEESAIHYLKLRDVPRPDLRGSLSVRPENRISPGDVTARKKAALEIVPAPLPREHSGYTETMVAGFRVRFQGEPLANREVVLRTGNGSRLTGRTDESGMVTFTIPRDFARVGTSARATPPATMRLHTAHRADGKWFRTSLTLRYGPDPDRWRSFAWAGVLLAAGLVAGGVTARRVNARSGDRERKRGARRGGEGRRK
ncbi:hypothetical protein AN478_09410 [Thiohalorhabdus denitrificans]|nr:hypothetical protein AN478_09410 [Thiohalorhabdus denitrificans]